MRDLRGKVAVITGGASGIGRAVAGRCAAEGMKVVIADVEEKALAAAEKELTDAGAEALGVVTDVSDDASVDALAQRTVDHFGGVHLVHNNAGVATGGLSWELSLADWEWVLGVNMWGVIHGIKAFVPRMLAGGDEGHVVNTASLAGLTTTPFMGPYNASKHAVVTLSEGLYKELAMTAAPIHVSVLCPGFVKTGIAESGRNRPDALRNPDAEAVDMTAVAASALGQMIESGLPPDDVAAMVLDAVREERFYILTHPELNEGIRVRMDDILEGRPPTQRMIL